jgi:tetratricopeptide (TPR) repeat protein
MSVGLVDRAETLYAQVADADPQNSIAVVGLARVRLERGDEAGALELARRALAIDPENAAAQRMVERLEEVLAYRGVQAGAPTPTVPEPELPILEPAPALEPDALLPSAAPVPVPPQPPPAPPVPKRRSWLDRLFRRR